MALTRFESIDSLTRFLAVAGVLAALGFLVPVQDVLAQEKKPAATVRPPHDPAESLPQGALACFGSFRFRHGDRIESAALAADGKTLVTLSPGRPDGTKVWNVADGKLRRSFGNNSQCAVILDDTTLVLGAAIFDLKSGQQTRLLATPVAPQALALSPDGKTLATWTVVTQFAKPGPTGGTNVVCLIDVASGKVKHVIQRSHDMAVVGNVQQQTSGEFTSIRFLAFTADGKSIAAGSWDNSITLFEVASGEFVREFGGVKQPAHHFALSPDGNTLAMACFDKNIRFYELRSGKEVFKFTPDASIVNDIVFAPDGKSLAVAGIVSEGGGWIDGDGIWDVATGKKICRLPASSARLIYGADGKTLISCGSAGTVRIFDPANGRELHPRQGHTGMVYGLTFTADGQTLISEAGDRTIRWWDLKTGKQTHQREGFCNTLYAALVQSPDGRLLATRSDDRSVSLREADTGKEKFLLRGHPGFIYPLAFTPDGKRLVSAERDGPAIVWNVADGTQLYRIDHPFPKFGGETVALSNDAALLAIAKQSHVAPFGGPHECVIIDVADRKELIRFNMVNSQPPSIFRFTHDKKTLIAGTYDGFVCFLDTATGKETLRFKGSETMISSLALSPDGTMIATSASKWKDNAISVWQTTTGKLLLEYPAHGYQIYSLAFSPDSTMLASGGADSNIVLWDLRR